ncbi:hypothetical protein HGRIS_004673 [Hohenbuehelia grisea]|uniref:DUF7770 domain-containing protein n=1 Tax=Hohenbuehelia grisea TaxID=104357 RepID=A0ABR3JE98_9AGAR
MNSFAGALQASAARRAAQAPIWLQPQHANTTLLSGVYASHLQSQVTEIVVHASKSKLGEHSNVFTGHFRIYLVLEHGQSIQLNSFRFLSDGTTKLEVKYCPYEFSVTRTFMSKTKFPVAAPFTVRQALECLLMNNRDHYVLDSSTGSGCRYWCYVVLVDFARQGWIHPQYVQAVEYTAEACRQDPRWADVGMPNPAPQGSFYA